MSIKTLRKRIALVAVSAMGFGLLTTTGANAAASTIDVTSASVCAAVNDAGANIVNYDSSTSGVNLTMPVGGAISIKLLDTEYLQLSGPVAVASIDDATSSLNATGKVTLKGTATDSSIALSMTAVGSVTLVEGTTADELVASNGSNVIYITVVAACTTSTFSASKSGIRVTEFFDADSNPATPDTNAPDTAPAYIDGDDLQAEAGNDLYIAIAANNAYGNALPAGIWTVSATNGATVALNSNATNIVSADPGLFPFASNTTYTGNNIYVRVTPKDAAVASTTTVTVSYNGAVITSKNLSFLGEATKITVIANTVGKVASSGMTWYTLQDAAGNNVPGAVTVDTTTLGSRIFNITKRSDALQSENATSVADNAYIIGGFFDLNDLGPITYGILEFSCSAAQGAGTGTATLKHTNAVSGDVITLPVTFTCAGGLDTYTVSMDKASYKVGEIATLTITAKDSKGNPVNDFTRLNSTSAPDVTVGGGVLTKATATTDVFGILNTLPAGVKQYKVQLTTAGSFNAVVNLPGTTTKSATAGYTVTSDGVSNAEVLAAIVKLIASISKQIKLLQKQLKKK